MTQSETRIARQENTALALGFHRLGSQLIIIHIGLQGEAEAMTSVPVTLVGPKRPQTASGKVQGAEHWPVQFTLSAI